MIILDKQAWKALGRAYDLLNKDLRAWMMTQATPEQQEVFLEFARTLKRAQEEQDVRNAKTRELIAERRKYDKQYARKKEVK